jgi:cob(I)alamin adenosyltransferase
MFRKDRPIECAYSAIQNYAENVKSFRHAWFCLVRTPEPLVLNMPPRTVSRDLKDRIPVLFLTSYNPFARHTGRPRLLNSTDIQFIEALVEQCHTIYIDEIQERLLLQRDIWVSFTTLVRTMRRLELSRKCVSVRALERNNLVRSAYMNRMADLVALYLFFKCRCPY